MSKLMGLPSHSFIGFFIKPNIKHEFMKNKDSAINPPPASKTYLAIVSLLTFVIPLTGFILEHLINKSGLTFLLFGKWFIFSAVGLRLFMAGLRQTTQPGFTSRQIFHIEGPEALPIVRELGFANLCFGLVGLIALFIPGWRVVSAAASGLYYGLAGLQHLIKRPAGANEWFALWTDLLIFALLALFLFLSV